MNSIPTFQTLADAFSYCRDMDASLAARLDAFNDATRYLLPGYQEAVDRLVARLKSAGTVCGSRQPALSRSLMDVRCRVSGSRRH